MAIVYSPLVSIIVPVYNVSNYIERCIQSVINQTYSQIECIVVDDCSPDDSMDKCCRLIERYNGPIRFIILHHESNCGLSAARNSGIEKATGDYLFFLDSDDELLGECITLLVSVTEPHPNVEIVQGFIKHSVKGLGNIPPYLFDIDYVEDNNWIRAHFYRTDNRLPVQATNKLIKTDFLLKNQLYFKEGIIYEDALWMYYVVKKLKKFAVVKEVTYNYYVNSDSISRTITSERATYHWGEIISDVVATLDHPYYECQLYSYLKKMVLKYDGLINHYKKYVFLANSFSIKLCRLGHIFDALCLLLYIYTLPINRKKKGRRCLVRNIKNSWAHSFNREQRNGIH